MSEKLIKPLLQLNIFSLFIDAALCALAYFSINSADRMKNISILLMLLATPITAILLLIITKHSKVMRKLSNYYVFFSFILTITVIGWCLIANKMTNNTDIIFGGMFYLYIIFIINLGFVCN